MVDHLAGGSVRGAHRHRGKRAVNVVPGGTRIDYDAHLVVHTRRNVYGRWARYGWILLRGSGDGVGACERSAEDAGNGVDRAPGRAAVTGTSRRPVYVP